MNLLKTMITSNLVKSTHHLKLPRTSNGRLPIQLPLQYTIRPSMSFLSSETSSNPADLPPTQDLITLLRSDLKHSMKVKDFTQRDVIKSLLGDLQNSEHTKNPQSHQKIIDLAIKKRVEAARISLDSSPPRTEINQQNLNEVKVLKKYASFLSSTSSTPNLSSDDLIKIVDASITNLGLSADSSLQDRQSSLGKLIKSVKEKVDDNFDGKEIADTVKKALQLA